MAEGDRGGGWVPPNGDGNGNDDDRTDRPGGLSSGDPLGGGLSSGDPLGGSGGSQSAWQPPAAGGGEQQSGWQPPGGGAGQTSGWEPPSGSGGAQPGGWPSSSEPQSAGQWSPPPSGGHWGGPQQGGGQWGGPQQGGFGAPQGGSNGKATASLICGIVGLIFCPIIFSIAAIVLGYQARKEIDASQGRQTNRGLATAGIITGWIGIAFGILLIILIAAGVLAGLSTGGDGQFEFSEPAFSLLSGLPL